jgi:hypothetical protein
MRLVHRHRHGQRGKALRIAISQEEITADLHYPAGSRKVRQAMVAAHRTGNR